MKLCRTLHQQHLSKHPSCAMALMGHRLASTGYGLVVFGHTKLKVGAMHTPEGCPQLTPMLGTETPPSLQE